jgi:trehalose synthase
MHTIEEYRKIVGDDIIYSILKKASRLYDKSILHVNSTQYGGGVAEILTSLLPLMNDVGLEADWRILRGTPDFFTITKKFHNALQGDPINFTDLKQQIYIQNNEDFSSYFRIDGDFVVIHDNQPLPLIKLEKKRQPWIWRCHVDFSNPNEELIDFLKDFILRYDLMIVSSEKYLNKDIPLDYKIIPPAIDPLTPKNKELSQEVISKYLKKSNIPTDKPIITQISRFDKWKDPEGVIDVFKLVKKEIDCRLILCGSMATDDPEGTTILEKIRKKAQELIDKKDIILITSENNILVNILQRTSNVIIQKSIKEGFGLTVTEALWKEKPVVGSDVGGISIQIKDGENGFLSDPFDEKGFADRIIQLLQDPELSKKFGEKGKKTVIDKFLITRLMIEHLDLFYNISP